MRICNLESYCSRRREREGRAPFHPAPDVWLFRHYCRGLETRSNNHHRAGRPADRCQIHRGTDTLRLPISINYSQSRWPDARPLIPLVQFSIPLMSYIRSLKGAKSGAARCRLQKPGSTMRPNSRKPHDRHPRMCIIHCHIFHPNHI